MSRFLPQFTALACLLVMSLAVTLTFSPGAGAVEIYAAVLSVDSRSDSNLERARRAALKEVVIKASGDASVGELATVQRALSRAQSYLLGYSYQQGPDNRLALRFEFDENAVQGLLSEAGLPLWTANRPMVTAWLVLSDGPGRSFVSADQKPLEYDALRVSFEKRGVPLQVPLFDLEDSAMITPGAAWRQSSAKLLEASARYRDSELLAGRVARLSDGQWIGDWRFFDQGRWVTRPVSVPSLVAFTDAGAALVAETMAQRYAVISQDDTDRRYLISFRGVRSYSDFMALHASLGAFEAVHRVVPERLLGDALSVRVEAEADLTQLARIIELDRRFVPTPAPPGELGLHYEWIQ